MTTKVIEPKAGRKVRGPRRHSDVYVEKFRDSKAVHKVRGAEVHVEKIRSKEGVFHIVRGGGKMNVLRGDAVHEVRSFRRDNPREFAELPHDYASLCSLFLPRRIRNQEDYDATVAMAELMAGHDLSPDQEDYFDTLSTLIEVFDVGRVKWKKISSLRLLKSVLEEAGLTGADLSRILGVSRLLGPMILRGEREITASHARILGKHFHIRPGAFIE